MSTPKDNKPLIHAGASHSAPYPVSRLSAAFNVLDLAQEVEQAEKIISTTSHAKLKLIAEQMLQLKQQARQILEDTQKNNQLHRAQCQFQKIPGKTYHLYKKPDQQLYFSMLNPQEWGDNHADYYQGAYTLQADMSWLEVNNSEEMQTDIDGLLDSL